MKKLLSGLILLLLFAGTAAAQVKEITIINNTEYPIREIYVSSTSSDEWGENLVEDGQIVEWGDEIIIKVDTANECYFDFKLVDNEDDFYRKWEVNLCETMEVEFIFDDYVEDDEDYYDDYYDDYLYDYDEGYDQGYAEGYQEGFTEGYGEAYQAGYQDALDSLKQ